MSTKVTPPSSSRPVIGVAAIIFAILFNVPYAGLAASYDYPHVLRRPAGEALDLFLSGGSDLIWTWYGFGLAALALVPMALVLTVTPRRMATMPGLTLGAVLAGALAGITQGMGLLRWVFVVPDLAHRHAAEAISTEDSFRLINAYGGVAIGEHMGQLLTALFVLCLSLIQWRETARLTSAIGLMTVAAMGVGTGEGLALATGASGDVFSLFTTASFMGLTLWLIATGVGLIRGAR